MKLTTNFKDFPVVTATFKALNFYFEIQGLSRHVRTLQRIKIKTSKNMLEFDNTAHKFATPPR